MATIVLFAFIIGIVSTLVLDIWAQIQKRMAGVAAPNWGIAGRWVLGLARGEFVLRDSESATSSAETTIGWLFHYAVGIVYGFALFAIGGPAFAVDPTFVPPLIVGVGVATFAGLFIFLPGLGAGIAGARLPNRKIAIARMLVGHVLFAVAEFVTALILAAFV